MSEKDIKFMNILTKENFLKDVSVALVSPLYNFICIISQQKEAHVHVLPYSSDESSFWQSPSKTKTCLFSEDGKQLLLLLSVNSIHIFKIDENAVTSSIQFKASTLATVLKHYNIDYLADSKVVPLKLRRSELMLEIGNRLVCLEWGFAQSEPSIKYTVVLPPYCDMHMSSNKIFLLESTSYLSAYNLANGHKFSEALNICLANRANADISIGRIFTKFDVDSTGQYLAVVNQDEVTVLFDLADIFDNSASKPLPVEESKKDKWVWPGKKKSIGDGKPFPCRIVGQVPPFPGVVVSRLHFSLHGLFIFYSVLGHSSCSCFKVVNTDNGQLLCAMEGLVEHSFVNGGHLPLFMSTSILSICIGALSTDPFILRLCDVVSEFTTKDVELTQLNQSTLKADVYVEFIKIAFSLHSNLFKRSLKKLCESWRDEPEMGLIEKRLTERLDSLCSLVLRETCEEKIISFGFLHTIHLLDLTCLSVKSARGRSTLSRLENLIVYLLSHLGAIYPAIKHLDLLRYEWLVWRGIPDQDVVEEAVILGTVALALTFFTSERGWEVNLAVERFKVETKEYIVKLISVGDLEKATLALRALGSDPIEHFRELCLTTNEPLLRDLLVGHLRVAERLLEEEESAWKFCKQIENSLSTFVKNYRSFEHKLTVSATERAPIIMIKLMPFKGSMELKIVLNQSQEWRQAVITELYFVTGDVTLEPQLCRDRCWQYLLEKNCIDLLTHWIDVSFAETKSLPTDYLTKMLLSMLSRWPVTPEMLDTVLSADCMAATKSFILDRAASYGVFSISECSEMPSVIRRLQNLCLLPKVAEILKKQTANVTYQEFYAWVLKECAKNNLKVPILSVFRDSNTEGEAVGETPFDWLSLWREFEWWDGSDNSELSKLMRSSLKIVTVNDNDAPFVKIAIALVEKQELVELIEEEGASSNLLKIPQIDICWQSLQRAKNHPPDVTLYDLLTGSRLPVDRLFGWQSENKYLVEPVVETFPHFNHQVLCAKLGYKIPMDFLYYLKQGRPSVACNRFILESFRAHRRLTTQMYGNMYIPMKRINRACGLAHGLALRLWRDNSVGNACVAFIAMLGDIPTANALRLHLAAIAAVTSYLPEEQKKFFGNLVYGIVSKDAALLQDFSRILEGATMDSISSLEPLIRLKQWSLPVTFCNLHGIPLPTLLPRSFIQEKDWFHFLLCLDLFKYPYDTAIELIEEMEAPILKSHLLRALTRTTLKVATTSPSKSPPRIRLEPENGTDDLEIKDVFQAYVTNVYTEVLTTIQTFTDRNFVSPWSCEQNPDEDVLLTLMKCESESDTSRALLLASLELQSPILALLSTSYQADNVSSLLAWLLASVPSSLPRNRLREDGELLLFDRSLSPELVQDLLLQFFSTGYIQTFYRGLAVFLPDNPLTFVVEGIYRCVIELDAPGSLTALKAFVVEMVNGEGRIKDPIFGALEWIIGTAYRLIEHSLTLSDIHYSVKIIFLQVLAEAEVKSISEVYPDFLLWNQVCDILEPTKVRINFYGIYDILCGPAEIERCLEELVEEKEFSAALEMSALGSLNKDRIITAIWEQKFLEVGSDGDYSRLWNESSAAFKDENVNPTLVSVFYYKIAALFSKNDTISVQNKYYALKYCLDWRKLVEDTLLPSFREQSDSIELEMWECCLKEDFNMGLLRHSKVSETFALVVSQWPPPKLLVRAPMKDAPNAIRVSQLISALLDAGDLISALRVSSFFTCESQDLTTILSCLQVSLGELPAAELAQYSSLLSCPRKLLTSPLDSVADPQTLETSPGKEPPPVLGLLERLCRSVTSGSDLAYRICVCAKLSFALDIPFLQLVAETNYLQLLERVAAADCGNKMAVTRDVLWLAGLPESKLAQFLSERIVKAFNTRLISGLDIPAKLWEVNLDDSFHRIISLMQNPATLGLELLNASVQLPFAEAVEVLIRAHDCYTVSCNVEGIGLVLRRARIISLQILQAQQWRHLVRLLLGIGRYGDMAYIFQMLKDNEQFEYLLRRGSAKAPGLHLAISDFLQRTCPENRELARIVAIAFGLHAHQALLWETEANEIISKIVPPLKDTNKIRQTLTLAMENYSNSAMCYLEAQKMNKALKIAKKSQVVALQISLLGTSFILNLNQPQFQTLAQETLSVSHIMLLIKARDLQLDWMAVLHQRWIINGDKTFFNELKTAGILTPPFISRYVLRYEKDQNMNGRSKERIKQLSALIPSFTTSSAMQKLGVRL